MHLVSEIEVLEREFIKELTLGLLCFKNLGTEGNLHNAASVLEKIESKYGENEKIRILEKAAKNINFQDYCKPKPSGNATSASLETAVTLELQKYLKKTILGYLPVIISFIFFDLFKSNAPSNVKCNLIIN